ncbi:type VI secretion system-associated protein TagF [Roseospira marina]|uniref:Type VI secretion system-associated protein TagF n=1 Tax=Roseospira marina TaxID=140057 RepID=A0A5M6IF48_9PROT|nr:type VI secretion system-associated protein TagF [Roseospira marina]KAA5606916.1 type VI secretion system-associated protein TagF [Roseospira marina]MBB4312913.1 type VI secretion system protein ImpM [Roseospira marina]MBB5086314.1 type VI secretion system protein ImpM [Roseospira marina]
MAGLGFYGKLPAHGDFVRRGLDHTVTEPWDAWLGRLMTAVRDDLGEDEWLELYLTGPIWRFAFGAGVAGQPQTGVMVPSVDRVGRYFPLVLSAPLDGPASLPAAMRDGRPLLDAMEDLALAVLEDGEPMDADHLEAELNALEWVWPAPPDRPPLGLGQPGIWLPLGGETAAEGTAAVSWLLDGPKDLGLDGEAGLWWTDGSERVAPGLVRVTGWPRPSAAVAFFDGAWNDRGWTA